MPKSNNSEMSNLVEPEDWPLGFEKVHSASPPKPEGSARMSDGGRLIHALETSAILMAVDVESWMSRSKPVSRVSYNPIQGGDSQSMITEVGLCIYDPKKIQQNDTMTLADRIRGVCARHLRFKERSHMTNPAKPYWDVCRRGCEECFQFGHSEFIDFGQLKPIFEELLDQPTEAQTAKKDAYDMSALGLDLCSPDDQPSAAAAGKGSLTVSGNIGIQFDGTYEVQFGTATKISTLSSAVPEPTRPFREIYLIGHDLRKDVKWLKEMSISLTGRSHVFWIDTQAAARELMTYGLDNAAARYYRQIGLKNLAGDFGLNIEHAHNSGNDAAYTLFVALCMAEKGAMDGGLVFNEDGKMRNYASTEAIGKIAEPAVDALIKSAASSALRPPYKHLGTQNWCSRCKKAGHVRAECRASLYCDRCECAWHITDDCNIADAELQGHRERNAKRRADRQAERSRGGRSRSGRGKGRGRGRG
ncbi:hypothetical protein K490DRAFT_61927 [Saccharata proteae CBS 121410]|uniref:Gfd2/YDR514C-like C-terminal domain-containing protein n=1 Tax=Saccharata proteae CBS 121410 TaxID=1314787 RepID=A0A9P4HWQ0_9PEZI|nr:hypothetical protein K490DRAFT_61927 [Saccharata proteae CBS 121410]